jgi:two-component system, response regulator
MGVHWHSGRRSAFILEIGAELRYWTVMEKPSPTILLAEDSDDDAFFFQRALKKADTGCSFVRAGNGKIAVDMLSGKSAQGVEAFLLFLDLKMPVMSGFDVLTWLGSASLELKPRVVVLSGSNDQADRARAFELGASDYMVKPITVDVLRAKVFEELAAANLSSAGTGATV